MKHILLALIASAALACGAPVDLDHDSELIVLNQTGQILSLSIDGGPPLEVVESLTVDVPAGEHFMVLSTKCGDTLPRADVMEAGQAYTWTVTRAPECNE